MDLYEAVSISLYGVFFLEFRIPGLVATSREMMKLQENNISLDHWINIRTYKVVWACFESDSIPYFAVFGSSSKVFRIF